MKHPLDRRHFLATLIGRPFGHHGFLIPTQTPGDLRQRFGVTLKGHQF
jgi:hypothetical protein